MSAPPRVNYGDATRTFNPTVKTSSPPVGASIHTISLLAGVYPVTKEHEMQKLEQFAINQGIKTALQNSIVTSVDGLTARPFLPDVDFVDGNNNSIGVREWQQPWSGTYTNVSAGAATTIYQTGNLVRYDRKVYVFWGLSYTSVGNHRSV